ncbi:MAG: YbhB/YbcL family Raf kinase inhibitor-like protein [Solirubrobacterales bacterium]
MPTIDIPLASSTNLNPISATYTCDGADISPPISWSQIPAHTVELQLYIFNFLPVGGKLFADWAVAGLSPSLHGLAAGRLPAGAIVGRNGSGQTRYSLCPAKGANTRFAFLLYALPQRIAAKPGFDANAMREQALHTAEHAGLLAFSYRRH